MNNNIRWGIKKWSMRMIKMMNSVRYNEYNFYNL
jgi:hypothetical protein